MSRPLAGGVLVAGRYRVESVIAHGGMGVVYRAVDERLARPVAMKVLLPELATDIEAIKRFEREGIASARLNHAGIVQTYDYGTTPDPSGHGTLCFIVMEHVSGVSVASALAAGPMSPLRVMDIADQALSALACAHAAGITHRDLKPANLMLVTAADGREHVKVVDFGLAQIKTGTVYTRLTQTGQLLGTPLYMAPEQARGEPCDARTDVYALGLVLWSCLTGREPYSATDMASVIVKVLEEVPPRADGLLPSVPPALAMIIDVAIQKSPAQRFASVGAFAAAIAEARGRMAQAPSRAPMVSMPSMAHASTVPAMEVRGPAGGAIASEAAPSVALRAKPAGARSSLGLTLGLVALVGLLLMVASTGGWFLFGRGGPGRRGRTRIDTPAPTDTTTGTAPTIPEPVAPVPVPAVTDVPTPTSPTTPTTPTTHRLQRPATEPESVEAVLPAAAPPIAPPTDESAPVPAPEAVLPPTTSAAVTDRYCRMAVRCCELMGAPHDTCQSTMDDQRAATEYDAQMCRAVTNSYADNLEQSGHGSPECAHQ